MDVSMVYRAVQCTCTSSIIILITACCIRGAGSIKLIRYLTKKSSAYKTSCTVWSVYQVRFVILDDTIRKGCDIHVCKIPSKLYTGSNVNKNCSFLGKACKIAQTATANKFKFAKNMWAVLADWFSRMFYGVLANQKIHQKCSSKAFLYFFEAKFTRFWFLHH